MILSSLFSHLSRLATLILITEMQLLCLFWQLEDYQKELEEMKTMTRQEYVAHLRRHV